MNAQARGISTWLVIFISLLFFAWVEVARAVIPDPGGGGGDPPPVWLDHWSFNDTTNWHCDHGHSPMSFTNLDTSFLGNWTALSLDNTNAAWLRYKVVDDDGTNHIKVDRGSVMFWFAPYWSGTNAGGSGPGQWARLIEVGEYTTNASYGWWSLFTDPEGVNLYFCAQTNGAGTTFLSAPIEWTTNRWHLIALNYSATNSVLYLDGMVATNGTGVTVWPGPDVLANGFTIGSDATGVAQARGMIDDLVTYAAPQSDGAIATEFILGSFPYYMNPANFANLMSSAGSSASYGPTFNAITGRGWLSNPVTNSVGCVESSSVWLTNVSATSAGNSMNLTFTIVGGTNGALYDVFASSILFTADSTNSWAWMGQGYHCTTYTLTNLPTTAAYVLLGTPRDSDFDGLTDAYENLVSKTDPNNPDTDGDGLLDGWEVLWGLNLKGSDASKSNNYFYDAGGWLRTISGMTTATFGLDAEGNVQ